MLVKEHFVSLRVLLKKRIKENEQTFIGIKYMINRCEEKEQEK